MQVLDAKIRIYDKLFWISPVAHPAACPGQQEEIFKDIIRVRAIRENHRIILVQKSIHNHPPAIS